MKEVPVRQIVATLGISAVLALGLAGCSDSHPASTPDDVASTKVVKHDCSDPNWRKANLGLWYSVCRPPMRW